MSASESEIDSVSVSLMSSGLHSTSGWKKRSASESGSQFAFGSETTFEKKSQAVTGCGTESESEKLIGSGSESESSLRFESD